MTSYTSIESKLLQLLHSEPTKTQNILVSIQNTSQFWITLNRPKKSNSFSMDMYIYFIDLIQKANDMPQVKYIVITGNGGNFCSGNDLNNFMDPRLNQYDGEDRKLVVKTMTTVLERFCNVIIESRKPIFALIEGKAIGMAFTILAMLDKVFAAENCQFMAPLVKTAQGPELCSSYLFPKFFGKKLAEEIVIEGRWVNADLAEKYGLIQKHQNIKKATAALKQHLAYLDQLEWESYIAARCLFRQPEREILKKTSRKESENLYQRWNNPKLVEFIMSHMTKVRQRKTKN